MVSDSLQVGDAFAQGYDTLLATNPGWTELDEWPRSRLYKDGRRTTASQILPARAFADGMATATGPRIARSQIEGKKPAYLLGALRALDEVCLATADASQPPDPAWIDMRSHFRRTGRLNDLTDGLVIPGRTQSAAPTVQHESLASVFHTLRVCQEVADKFTWIHVDILFDYPPGVDVLSIAQVPMATVDDVERTVASTASGAPMYILTPVDALASRVTSARAAMGGYDLGLTAEATITETTLARWMHSPPHDAPTWILVGTGPIESWASPGGTAVSADPLDGGVPVPLNLDPPTLIRG